MKKIFVILCLGMFSFPAIAGDVKGASKPTYQQLQDQVRDLANAVDLVSQQRDEAVRNMQNLQVQLAILKSKSKR